MKYLNEKEYIDNPKDYKANDPKVLNKLNDPETGLKAQQSAQNDAIATRMAKDVASSFGKSPPKSIPYMPPYKRINQQSISGPVTKANEENTMSLNDKKTLSVADAVMKIMEAEKAKMDHDQDGKIESPKAEYLGSRIRAAKMAGKLKEELKGNQHKIDANKNGKIDAHDFKLLRAKKPAMKEEAEEFDEAKKPMSQDEKDKVVGAVQAAMRKSRGNVIAGQVQRAAARLAAKVKHGMKEEVEELDEAFPTVADGEKSLRAKEGKTSMGTVSKTKTGLVHTRDYEDDSDDTPAKKGRPTGGGAGKSTKKKKLSEMIAAYKEKGIDSLYEEPDNATFTKELEDQKAKFDGKKKGADVAKPSVQAVKMEEADYEADDGPLSEEQLDEISSDLADKWLSSPKGGNKYKKNTGSPGSANQTTSTYPDEKTYFKHRKSVNRAVSRVAELPHHKKPSYYKEEVEQIDERTLTPAETEKKETVVKSMKKGLSGFRQRYGDRAKEVMYATATKIAKKD